MQTQTVPHSQATSRVQPRAWEGPDPRLEARLEALCQKGCRLAWDDLAALERGAPLPETHDLTPAEVRWLLTELKQVMSVYGARCTTD